MDEVYMRKALSLSKKAQPFPNPQVGAVLVKDGKVIGQGYHKKYGDPHAEVEAFQNCKVDPKGSKLYVTLEPCSHYGKTPPCTDLIIKKGVSEVIISKLDPNPKVDGVTKLRKAGIKVRVINPYITLKIASSMDAKIWSPTCTKITSKESKKFTDKLRRKNDAILIGIGTMLQDNPRLDPSKTKIILDSNLKTPLNANIFKNGKTLICTTIKDSQKRKKLEELRVTILTFPTLSKTSVLLKKLASLGYERILIEGGQRISTSFLKNTDEFILLIGNKTLGEKGLNLCKKALPSLMIESIKKHGPDEIIRMYPITLD